MRWARAGLAAVLALLGSGRLEAQCQVAQPIGEGTTTNDNYGFVAVDCTTMAVGATEHGINNTGAAYVFEFDGTNWEEVAKLLPKDLAPGDEFGGAVAIYGDTIVVGAAQHDDGKGAAFVFVKPDGGWANGTPYSAKLVASDAAPNDRLGVSAAISGDTVAVGAINSVSETGAVYVFARPAGGWASGSETAKLTVLGGGSGQALGRSLAIDGDTIVSGAELGDAAYVFIRPLGGWAGGTQTAKLSDSDGAQGFGYGVDVRGRTIGVGAYLDDMGGNNAGSAYVYVRPQSGWVDATEANARLTSSAAAPGGHMLGLSVSVLCEDTIFVGTHAGQSATTAGYVCVYKKPPGGWVDAVESKVITPDDGQVGDQFGTSIDTSCDTLVVGANRDDDNGDSAGSAYVFAGISGTDFNDNGMPDVCERPCPADYNGDGTVDTVDFLGLLEHWGDCP